jgi:hypothetical protein
MQQSQLIISPKGKLMAMIPHYLLINDQLLGAFKGKEAHINLPPGRYKVTIRSLYKFIESTIDVYIPIGESKRLTFTDRDKVWNWLFNIDLVLWLLKRILHVPEPWGTIYEIVSNGFFAIWLLRICIIRKHYFAIKEEQA